MSTQPKRTISHDVSNHPQKPAADILYLHQYRPAHKASACYFPIIVDEALTSTLQDVVIHACNDSVKSIKVEPLPLKHQSRIWIQLKNGAFSDAMHAIIMSLPGAEVGPVMRVPA